MIKSKLLLFGFVLAFVFSSCGEDEEETKSVNCDNFAVVLKEETDAVTNAAMAYGTDPSSANCNAYVDALTNYLEAVEPFVEKCGDDESFAQWKDAIDQFETIKSQISAACG